MILDIGKAEQHWQQKDKVFDKRSEGEEHACTAGEKHTFAFENKVQLLEQIGSTFSCTSMLVFDDDLQ